MTIQSDWVDISLTNTRLKLFAGIETIFSSRKPSAAASEAALRDSRALKDSAARSLKRLRCPLKDTFWSSRGAARTTLPAMSSSPGPGSGAY